MSDEEYNGYIIRSYQAENDFQQLGLMIEDFERIVSFRGTVPVWQRNWIDRFVNNDISGLYHSKLQCDVAEIEDGLAGFNLFRVGSDKVNLLKTYVVSSASEIHLGRTMIQKCLDDTINGKYCKMESDKITFDAFIEESNTASVRMVESLEFTRNNFYRQNKNRKFWNYSVRL